MERLQARAVVLRRTPYRDNDLIVDLLTLEHGRVSALARGGRSSRKRYGGALELGTRIALHATRRGGLATLGEVNVEGAINHIRGDLDGINQLSYALELARLTAREGDPDPDFFGLLTGFIDRLEATGPNHEALLLWEIALLTHLGYRLVWDRCVVSGGRPDALSLLAGGTVRLAAARPPDATPVAHDVLDAVASLTRGQVVEVDGSAATELRRALTAVWQGVTGKALRTAAFL